MDLIKGALWMLGFGLIGGLFGFWIALDTSEAPDIAVAGYEVYDPGAFETSQFRFHNHSESSVEGLRERLLDGEFDGVISFTSVDEAELWIPSERGWVYTLNEWLNDLRRDLKLREFQIESFLLEDIEQGMHINTHYEITQERTRADYFMAGGAIVLVLMAVFLGFGCLFAGITGEKQQRITEQVISAIDPQTWIDGKILGLAAVSMVAIVNALVAGLLYLGAVRLLWGWRIPLPTRIESPGLLLLALLLVFLGFLFWFAFLTAVAAIMDDPHTSTRNQLIFLPLIPLGAAFPAIGDPGALWVRILSVVPPSSGAVMPARLLVAEVPWWEAGLALALLIAAILGVRRLAGKVFRLGMLMYGKEPSWSEVRRWLREA
jgi:ABC-2 type transport system permease protein